VIRGLEGLELSSNRRKIKSGGAKKSFLIGGHARMGERPPRGLIKCISGRNPPILRERLRITSASAASKKGEKGFDGPKKSNAQSQVKIENPKNREKRCAGFMRIK